MTAMTAERHIDHALTNTLDAQARNDEQTLLLFNATTEIDSLMERICALRHHHVPQQIIDQLLADAAALYQSNRAEREHENTTAGSLDRLLRDLRNQRANGLRDQLNVRSLARALVPLLQAIEQPGATGLMARRSLDQLLDQHSYMLDLPSLAQRLGKGRHRQLTRYLAEHTS